MGDTGPAAEVGAKRPRTRDGTLEAGLQRETQKPVVRSSRPLESKLTHVETEQNRRNRINDGFSQLKVLLPQQDSKLDKASFLAKTVEYIKQLQGVLQTLVDSGGLSGLPEAVQWQIRMLLPRKEGVPSLLSAAPTAAAGTVPAPALAPSPPQQQSAATATAQTLLPYLAAMQPHIPQLILLTQPAAQPQETAQQGLAVLASSQPQQALDITALSALLQQAQAQAQQQAQQPQQQQIPSLQQAAGALWQQNGAAWNPQLASILQAVAAQQSQPQQPAPPQQQACPVQLALHMQQPGQQQASAQQPAAQQAPQVHLTIPHLVAAAAQQQRQQQQQQQTPQSSGAPPQSPFGGQLVKSPSEQQLQHRLGLGQSSFQPYVPPAPAPGPVCCTAFEPGHTQCGGDRPPLPNSTPKARKGMGKVRRHTTAAKIQKPLAAAPESDANPGRPILPSASST